MMRATILLNFDENTRQVEEEEKRRFLHSLLEEMGVPLDFWTSETALTIEQRMQLRKVLTTYGIQIIDNDDLEIFVEGEKIASWSKPHYKLKKDLSQLDPKKRLYLEMACECWSLFEESGSQE